MQILLNRFEKQRMAINDILSENEKGLVNRLREWTRQMSTIAGSTTRHNFIEFDEEETLQSLILDINPISKRKNLLKDARKGWSRLPYQTELFELVNLLWILRKLNIGKMLKMFISKIII